ncbi:HicB family toxin-antitoxin system [Mycolicibacterium aichiense]|uniref:HicB family toxin-antitoxin system n=1 Tax=Mycolicibacterium aichiense TaxID=1799 RepID=A0AAD1HM10_9MYCO|nr:HicB family toxin-antitoxin system [Mycolicibacterium aichiense]MCV7020377.1 HicB family toxin-antitoxin system [Mycolicibacterium aichiense]BBX07888.1 hypothetical protein MAIC_26910 [Mycolicibacterium aichiense]
MRVYKIEIVRDGRWWMIRIPEVHGATQVHRLKEAEAMAREYVALHLNVPLYEISIEITSIRMKRPEFREIGAMAEKIRDLREQARRLERESVASAREFAHWLIANGVPVRDIAELLDVSSQRVSQLTKD